MKRPLIDSGPVSEFGPTDPTLMAEERGLDFSEDMMYVPGFSDQRRQREHEVLEYQQGTRAGKDVSHLSANVYWTRRTSIGGTVDARKLMSAKNAGYRPVTEADVGKAWLTALGSGWTKTPEGHIINAAGDYQLMVLEGAPAANRAAMKQRKWLEQSGTVELAEAKDQEGVVKGREMLGRDGKSVVDSVRKKADGGLK